MELADAAPLVDLTGDDHEVVTGTGPEDTNGQAKHWCVTINNYTPRELAELVCLQDKLDYSIVGKEVGENGTPHLQCYLAFKKKIKFSTLKKLLPKSHLEIKRGTPKQAADYCKKEGDFEEYGTLPEDQTAKGTKASAEKWAVTKKLAQEGNLDEIDPQYYIKYYSTLNKIADDHADAVAPEDLTWENSPPNEWYYGPTGSGKSYKARRENPGFYLKMNNKWWENYKGQDIVLIEDVGQTHLWMGDFLKIWGDRYTFRCEKKFRSSVIRPKKIIITSNYHPQELWPDESILDPILRRFVVTKIERLQSSRLDVTPKQGGFIPPRPKKRKQVEVEDPRSKIKKTPRLKYDEMMQMCEINRSEEDELDDTEEYNNSSSEEF